MPSTKGLMEKGVPPQARWLLYMKIAILVLSLIVLAVAAYSLSLFGSYYGLAGSTGAGGYLIFTIKTFIVMGGATAIEIWWPHLFYRLIALVAYTLSIIFWLSAWAWAASTAALWLIDVCNYGRCSRSSYAEREGGALAACAGLGAIIWVLSIVNLFFFIRACLRDPQGSNPNNQAELGQVKQEPTPASYAAEQYPQQTTYPAHI
ncbi:hypothetical protein GE09DRAFT_1260788 [Coniochaeta sp. 2T2.1]|nr:hypothetical protein GE09DRAFT_1260788 [Coniochaeta sp. 2T2.1]